MMFSEKKIMFFRDKNPRTSEVNTPEKEPEQAGFSDPKS